MKFRFNYFYKPTSTKIRKIENILVNISLVISGYTLTLGIHWITIIVISCVILSKIITNIFTSDILVNTPSQKSINSIDLSIK